jgi:hypothetical protein
MRRLRNVHTVDVCSPDIICPTRRGYAVNYDRNSLHRNKPLTA